MTRVNHRARAVAVLVASCLGTLLLTAPASAAGPDTRKLCSDDRVRCSVQAPETWVSGSTHRVGVTGRPGSSVQLRAYLLDDGATAPRTWTPLGRAFRVRTNDKGWGSKDVRIDAPDAGEPGGTVVIAATETAGGDLPEVLGATTALLTGVPEVLGDGYGLRKPVGQPLALALDHVVPGTRIGVEVSDGGAWSRARAEDGAGAEESETRCAQTRCTVAYVVPRGLAASDQQFRLVDVRSGLPLLTWQVRPHADGTPRPRTQVTPTGAIGVQVKGSLASVTGDTGAVEAPRAKNLDGALRGWSGTAAAAGHDSRAVKVVAGTLAALGVLLLVVPGHRLPLRRGVQR